MKKLTVTVFASDPDLGKAADKAYREALDGTPDDYVVEDVDLTVNTEMRFGSPRPTTFNVEVTVEAWQP